MVLSIDPGLPVDSKIEFQSLAAADADLDARVPIAPPHGR